MTSEGQQHPGREPEEGAPSGGHTPPGSRTGEQAPPYADERQSAPGNGWASLRPGTRPEPAAPWAPPAQDQAAPWAPPASAPPAQAPTGQVHRATASAPASYPPSQWGNGPGAYPPPPAAPPAAPVPPVPLRAVNQEPEPWSPEEAWGTGPRTAGRPGDGEQPTTYGRPIDEAPAASPFAPTPEPATRPWSTPERAETYPNDRGAPEREAGRFESVRAAWREDAREQNVQSGPDQRESTWAPAEPSWAQRSTPNGSNQEQQPVADYPAADRGTPWAPPQQAQPAQPQGGWQPSPPAEQSGGYAQPGQFGADRGQPPAADGGQYNQPLGHGTPEPPIQREPGGYQPAGPVPGFSPAGVVPLPPQETRVPGATLAASPPTGYEAPSSYEPSPSYGPPAAYEPPGGYEQPAGYEQQAPYGHASPYGQPPASPQQAPGEQQYAEEAPVIAPVPHPRASLENPPTGRVSVPQHDPAPVDQPVADDVEAPAQRVVSASASVPTNNRVVPPPDHSVRPGPLQNPQPRVYGRPVAAEPADEQPENPPPAPAAFDTPPGAGPDEAAPASAPPARTGGWAGPEQGWSDDSRWSGIQPARPAQEHVNGFSHHAPPATAGSARIAPAPDAPAEPTGQFRGTTAPPYGDLVGSGPDESDSGGFGPAGGAYGGSSGQFPAGANGAGAPGSYPGGSPAQTPSFSSGPVSGVPVSGSPVTGAPTSGGPGAGDPAGFGSAGTYGQPGGTYGQPAGYAAPGTYGRPAGPHDEPAEQHDRAPDQHNWADGQHDRTPGQYGQLAKPAGPDANVGGGWDDQQAQNRFDAFQPEPEAKPQSTDAPAAEPVPQVRNGRVLLAVLVAAVLLVAIPLGLVWLLKPSDEAFNPKVGDCVAQSGEQPTSANCADAGAFKVVSRVDNLSECANQEQWIDVPAADGKQQVLCLEPATAG